MGAVKGIGTPGTSISHEPENWGVRTQEEWDAANARRKEESDARFFEQLMDCVRGQEHGEPREHH